jgi:hypothetical protein
MWSFICNLVDKIVNHRKTVFRSHCLLWKIVLLHLSRWIFLLTRAVHYSARLQYWCILVTLKSLIFAVCFMKLHWLLGSCESMKVMGLNSKQLKISTSPICKFIHDITSGEWQNTFWAIQIFIELRFSIWYFIIIQIEFPDTSTS